MFGLWIFDTGEASLVAALGNSPWTVLAEGVSEQTSIGIGEVTIAISFSLVLWIRLRSGSGWGRSSTRSSSASPIQAITLQWRHLALDGSAPHVAVPRAWVRARVHPPKSRHGRRSVPFAPEVVLKLRAARAASEWPGDEDLVFPSLTGTHEPMDGRHGAQGLRVLGAAGEPDRVPETLFVGFVGGTWQRSGLSADVERSEPVGRAVGGVGGDLNREWLVGRAYMSKQSIGPLEERADRNSEEVLELQAA